MDPTIWLMILAVLLVLVGISGLVLPAMPGAPVIFTGLLLAAWAEDFEYVGLGTLAVLGVLAVLTYVADFVAGAFGARRFGASRKAVIGATIGAIVGMFFGIPGILLGPFIGAVIGEYIEHPDIFKAGHVGVGAALGLALGIAAKMSLAFTMIGLFLIVRFF
jgi:uncharacterized protein YqgC (DUF456 family)